MIYLGKNAVGISDTALVVDEEVVNRINAVEIKETVSTPSSIMTITDGADNIPIDELVVGIEPAQDLHGYEHPWPAGGGKNKLHLVPGTYSSNGITVVVDEDGIATVNGTATDKAFVRLFLGVLPITEDMILSGCPLGGSLAAYAFRLISGDTIYTDVGEGVTIPSDVFSNEVDIEIRVQTGYTCTNMIMKPMLCASSASNPTTFAPYSNECPISGWTGANVCETGVNVWDEEVELGGINSSTGQPYASTSALRAKNYIPVVPGAKYYFKSSSSSSTRCWYDKEKNYISTGYVVNMEITAPDNAYFFRFDLPLSYGATYNNDISLNCPSTDTEYHPYTGQSYPITFPIEAGTVYGGTLTIHKDGTGTLVGKYAEYIFTGNESWGASSTAHRFYINNLNNYLSEPIANLKTVANEEQNAITNIFGRCSYENTDGIAYFAFPSGNPQFVVNESTAETIEDIKRITTGARLVYELATPITYTLTVPQIKTLLGTNIIQADTGAIQSLTYSADPKLYVDQHIPEVPVQDVQVNGTSILSQGVANVPIGSSSTFGVFKKGTGLYVSNGTLGVNASSDEDVKSGVTGTFTVAARQHLATFYGLAKAAGADMASSSNPVGTYTDVAKVAIQKMLGIYEAPWELIREDTFTNEATATHEVTVDNNGQSFELTDAILMFETPMQNIESSANGNLVFTDGSKIIASLYGGSWTQAANSVAHGLWMVAKRENGLTFVQIKINSSSTNQRGIEQAYSEGFIYSPSQSIVDSENFIIRSVKIAQVKGTGHYKLYGKRKWN